MRALRVAVAMALLVLAPIASATLSSADATGDVRVYLRHPWPSQAVFPPQQRYCTAPAADITAASAHEEAGRLVLSFAIADPDAPIDCVVRQHAPESRDYRAWVYMGAASPMRVLEIVTSAGPGESFQVAAGLHARASYFIAVPDVRLATDGAGGFTVDLPLAATSGARSYDIAGASESLEMYAGVVAPIELGMNVEAYDEANVEMTVLWHI